MNPQPDVSWPTDELISFALSHAPSDERSDPHWEAVRLLHLRGIPEVFDAAARLLASPCLFERALGARIHAQIGCPDRPFGIESTALLVRALDAETDATVILAALFAFGHLGHPDCIPTVLRFADHPDPEVRHAVAYALAGHDDDRAEAALIQLTTDPDVDVRDWATFGLGSQTERDTPRLRAALRARLSDPDAETRGEALKGLAVRRDECAVEAVVAELLEPNPYDFAVEAAETLADPRLVPALESLAGRWGDPDGRLSRAIEACRCGRAT